MALLLSLDPRIPRSKMINSICKKSKKIFPNSISALNDIKDKSVIIFGGFGLCGIPENLITGLQILGQKNLTAISNDVGVDDFGLGLLLQSKQLSIIYASYVGENKALTQSYLRGEIEVNLVPQGTLAEKLRCGGAGIPAFYINTGISTIVQHGMFPTKYNYDGSVAVTSHMKEARMFHGRPYILEESLTADYACIKAWKSDKSGNLIFHSTAQNFNPDCAKAARCTIAEVEEIVEDGELKPDEIHLPGIYVDRVIKGVKYEKRIEKLTVGPPLIPLQQQCTKKPSSQPSSQSSTQSISQPSIQPSSQQNTQPSAQPSSQPSLVDNARHRIAKRAAKEFKNDMYVNLGIGR